MAWGRQKKPAGKKPATKLERKAGQAEAAFLAMPAADQEAALAAVQTISDAVTGLKNFPPALVDQLGGLVVDFLIELHMPGLRKPPPETLVKQIIDGAPTLLGPHRARIEEAISAAAK